MSTKATLTRSQLEDLVRQAARQEFTKALRIPVSGYGAEPTGNIPNTQNKGADMVNFIRCLAKAGRNVQYAATIASHNLGSNSRVYKAITKAVSAGDMTAGGFLIPEAFSNEIIDLLRPFSVVRKIGPNAVAIPRGQLSVPVLTASATAAYVGENEDIPVSEPTFGEKNFSAKKIAAIIPVSNEALEFSNGQAERIIIDDIVKKISTQEDIHLLRGPGTENKPLGIRSQIHADNVLSSAGTTTSNIESDFVRLKNALDIANVRMVRPVWVMHPSRFNHLLTLRDANGNLVYPELRTARPTIHTIPVETTTNILTNLGGGTESEIYLIEASEVDLAEVSGMHVKISEDGAYTNQDSVLVSSFGKDQTLIRVTLQHDILMRHSVGAAVLTAVAWGAAS